MCDLKRLNSEKVLFENNIGSHILESQFLSLRWDYVNIIFPFLKQGIGHSTLSTKYKIGGSFEYNFIAVIEKHIFQYLYLTC